MNKVANSTRLRHDSDAMYNEWVDEFSAALDTIGLVQTSDTGQISLGALTRPSTGAFSGYQIRRFDDAMQATAPIFVKVRYGTNSGNTQTPQVEFSVGTGTNGAGTLTQTGMSGTMTGAYNLLNSNAFGYTTDTALNSRWVHCDGLFGVNWKDPPEPNKVGGSFIVCRTCDSDGVADGRGAMVIRSARNLSNGQIEFTSQSIRFASPQVAYTAQNNSTTVLGFMPQSPTNTLVGSDNQVALAWTITPLAEPLVGICGVYPAELPAHTTFNATLIGSTQRTYVTLSNTRFGLPSTMALAMLWE